jgi:hypothetical protein
MSKEAMKLALEALEQLDGIDTETECVTFDVGEAITALREALAEQPAQQEPVTWGVDWGKAGDIPCVSIIKRLPGGGIEVVAVEYAPYEYNPPAQRTWVGLTDREKSNLWLESRAAIPRFHTYATLVEAKLKEKNT